MLVGMASKAVLARLERIGQGSITPQQGLAALGATLAAPAPNPILAANPFSWATFLQHLPGGSNAAAIPTQFQEFASHMDASRMDASRMDADAQGSAVMGMPAGYQAERQVVPAAQARKTKEELLQLVSAAVRDVAGDIGVDEPLMSAGNLLWNAPRPDYEKLTCEGTRLVTAQLLRTSAHVPVHPCSCLQ